MSHAVTLSRRWHTFVDRHSRLVWGPPGSALAFIAGDRLL